MKLNLLLPSWDGLVGTVASLLGRYTHTHAPHTHIDKSRGTAAERVLNTKTSAPATRWGCNRAHLSPFPTQRRRQQNWNWSDLSSRHRAVSLYHAFSLSLALSVAPWVSFASSSRPRVRPRPRRHCCPRPCPSLLSLVVVVVVSVAVAVAAGWPRPCHCFGVVWFRSVSSSVVSVFGHRSLPSFSCSSSSLLATEPGAAGGAAVQRIRQNFNSLRPTASRQPVEVLSRRRRQRPSTYKDDCGGDCSQSNHSDDSQSK